MCSRGARRSEYTDSDEAGKHFVIYRTGPRLFMARRGIKAAKPDVTSLHYNSSLPTGFALIQALGGLADRPRAGAWSPWAAFRLGKPHGGMSRMALASASGIEATTTAPQPRVEQIPHGVAEHT